MSTAVRDVLTGPQRSARVLGVFPTAVYLGVDGDGSLVAVVTSDALRLPCAAVLTRSSPAYDLRAVAAAGAHALVGDGRVELPGLGVHAGRWWAPRVARPWTSTPTPPGDADHHTGLARALSAADPARAERVALSLLGRGEGLTPEGDDVLAGVLVAAHALPATHPAAATARHLGERLLLVASRRTTSLSAALLGHAAHGHGVPQLIDAVDALGGHGDLAGALRELRSVGHTSGAALARGCLTVAAAATPAYTDTSIRLETAS